MEGLRIGERRWLSHCGDMGDIFYGCATLKALGGGTLVLFNQPGKTSHPMTAAKAEKMAALLETQDYIDAVVFDDNAEDCSINGFRDHMRNHGVIADAHLATMGLGWQCRAEPWIKVDPEHVCDVVVHRSARYHNPHFDWWTPVRKYAGRIGFIGLEQERIEFCRYVDADVPLIPADDFLQVARAIAGSKIFIGNQSSPLAIAHAMFHDLTITEVCIGEAQNHCWFQRAGHIFGWDGKVIWPHLD